MSEKKLVEILLNENGIPQYPKLHSGRLLVALAAIAELPRPTAVSVSALTGLSKGHIDDYVERLNREFGTRIVKVGPEYRIESWGKILLESGVRECLRVPVTGGV